MSIHVRLGELSDADVIIDFNARMAAETEQLQLSPAKLQSGVTAVLLDSTKGQYFVAERAGQVVGQMLITFEWSDWRNGNIWWVQSVYVHPDHRRRGVFTALYRHVRKLASESGAAGLRLYVFDENAGAQDTYRRLGMHMSHYSIMEEIF